MSAGEWLNSLTFLDHLVILGFFAVSCGLTWYTLNALTHFYLRAQKDNPFANEIRITPLPFLLLAIVYTIILYTLFGGWITSLIESALA